MLIRGLPDVAESRAGSEQKVTQFASEHLNVAIHDSDVERAHRLGTYRQGRARPVIVKFSSYNTKHKLLLTGSKLKGTSYPLSGDYSPSVRFARKYPIRYEKEQSLPFKPRFDKLHIGDKTFVYHAGSSSVRELTR